MKTKQYIFLTNAYMPKPGATGVCVHQLAKALSIQGENVSVICYGEGKRSNGVYDGVNTIKIKDPFYIRPYRGNNRLFRFVYRIINILIRLLYYNKYPLRSTLLVNRFVKAVSEIVSKNSSLTLIASYTPLEGVLAAVRFKKKNKDTEIIYYSTDTLSNEQGESGILSAEKRSELGLKWEKYFFDNYDKIIIMECHKTHYSNICYEKWFGKFRFANFPLIIKPLIENKREINERYKKIVFAGNLYRKMRNPDYICQLIMSCFNSSEVRVTFIGGGDCINELITLCRNSYGVLDYLGFKPYSEVENALNDADVLLSIGNSFSSMCPSKIYEYMSTGKPIIHCYTYDFDPCLEPLSKYGNALLLKEKDESNKERMLFFMNNLQNIDFDLVADRFTTSTPQFTANIITS